MCTRPRSTGRLALPIALLFAAAAVPASAAVIPNAAEPAMVVGPDGLGILAYYDPVNQDLKVAHCVDAACTAVTTVTVDSAGDVGRHPTMVMGAAGPLIGYEDTTNARLKLALCADPVCATASSVVIDSSLASLRQNSAVALASDGRPLLAYVTAAAVPGPARLKTAHCEDAGCSTITVSDVSQAWTLGMALVVAGDGRGMISYTHSIGPSQNIAFLHCADVACTSGSLTNTGPGDAGGETPLLGPALGPPAMRAGADGFVREARTYTYFEGPSVKYVRCADAACTTANVATIPAQFGDVALAIGASDIPWLALHGDTPTPELRLVHCLDGNCSAQEPQTCVGGIAFRPSLALDAGGAPLVAFERGANVEVVRPPVTCTPMIGVGDAGSNERTPPTPAASMRFPVMIAPAASTTVQVSYQTADGTAQAGVDYVPTSGTLTFEPGQPPYQYVDVTILPDSMIEPDETLELALSAPVNVAMADGLATGVILNDDTPVVSTGDCVANEGDAGTSECVFGVDLSEPMLAPVSVRYRTSDGSATAGDYVPASGTLTFPEGTTSQVVSVSVVGDTMFEPDEVFLLELSIPVNATIGDGVGRGTIVNDDVPLPAVSVESAGLAEGDSGSADLAFRVRLSSTYPYPVTAGFATSDGTATAGSDYVASSGTVTFPPGTTTGTVAVPVLGDTAPEPNERFAVQLSSLVNATPGAMNADGHIFDDDWPSLSSVELTHGAVIAADLAADPGPAADQDYYAIALPPFTSHEVVLDGVSGDAAPGARLEMVAADGVTVVATSESVGTGSAASLRYMSSLPVAVTNRYVRVLGASCGTACGADDIYRLRAYDTTGLIPRFNNSGSQVTVLILQNTTNRSIVAAAHFWDPSGVRLATNQVTLPPRVSSPLLTSGVPGLAGVAGTITVTHDGPFGGLAGKAVALEPSTGFSFDSPLEYRPR